MKGFLYLMGITSSIGIYLIVFALMYALTEKDVLEIMAVDLILNFPFYILIMCNIERIIRRVENGKK